MLSAAVNLEMIIKDLMTGLGTTLSLFFLTLVLSLSLGLIVCLGRMSKNIIIRSIVKIYISIMRGTPLMLQLMVVFFGPYYLFGWSNPDRFVAAVIGFAINYAAYFAEIYRGGIESMPVGQYEAAQLLGFSRVQTFFRIILPQVVKRILPSITNEVITLVKDTSLVQVISVSEMFVRAKALASAGTTMVPYVVAGVMYYILNYAVAFTMEAIEKKLNYYK